MSFSQINIRNNLYNFKYYVEYIDSTNIVTNRWTVIGTPSTDNRLQLIDAIQENYSRNVNEWSRVAVGDPNQYIPVSPTTSTITLHFPRHSVETYETGGEYIVSFKIYVGNKELVIGEYLINRNDALANIPIRTFKSTEYFESYQFEIPDPHYITYDDDWKAFRQWSCDVPINPGDSEPNTDSALINIEVFPVELSADSSSQSLYYVLKKGYQGGSGSVPFKEASENMLRAVSWVDIDGSVGVQMIYNIAYGLTFHGFEDYLKETYELPSPGKTLNTTYSLSLKDATDVYNLWTLQIPVFSKTELQNNGEAGHYFADWAFWKPGLALVCLVEIGNDGEEPMLSILSNEIPFTQEVAKFIIGKLPSQFERINLDDINMNNYQFDVVNKINKQIVQLVNQTDDKANIVQPVFFKSYDLSNINIHPAVIENVGINLNAYKSKVNTFYLKVEGIEFTEIGRTTSNVLFKVDGKRLPGVITSGTYYILNENKELVTTGSYKYITE